jgi:cellulose binding protein with CBM2 domain/fibronectin type III domain protein
LHPSAVPVGLPGTPGQPTASAVTDRTATITWPSAVPGSHLIAKYEVHRQAGATSEQWGETAGTSFAVRNLNPGSRYTVNVLARDTAGNVSLASPPLTITTGAPAQSTCSVRLSDVNDWATGFVASLDITNTGTTPVNGWTRTFSWPTGLQQMAGGWNGTWAQNGTTVTVTNADSTLEPNATVNAGFVGNYTGPNILPTAFTPERKDLRQPGLTGQGRAEDQKWRLRPCRRIRRHGRRRVRSENGGHGESTRCPTMQPDPRRDNGFRMVSKMTVHNGVSCAIQSMIVFGTIGLAFILIGRPFPLFRLMFRDAAENHDVLYGAAAFTLRSAGNILITALLFLLLARHRRPCPPLVRRPPRPDGDSHRRRDARRGHVHPAVLGPAGIAPGRLHLVPDHQMVIRGIGELRGG